MLSNLPRVTQLENGGAIDNDHDENDDGDENGSNTLTIIFF